MSSCTVQIALKAGTIDAVWTIATNIGVIGGLATFGLSVVLWLLVLSRVDVSFAYPFVALGMVLTVVSGRLFLGENVTMLRIIGLVVIVGGVMMVALSSSRSDISAACQAPDCGKVMRLSAVSGATRQD